MPAMPAIFLTNATVMLYVSLLITDVMNLCINDIHFLLSQKPGPLANPCANGPLASTVS
jgi:hypothetical protein